MKHRIAWGLGFLMLAWIINSQGAFKRPVGGAGAWANTIAGAGMKGRIYTIESGGALYVTDPATGSWKQIGKPDFASTAFMFDAGGKLCTIEKDGSMYLVDPLRGTWKQSGKAGDWKNTIVGTALNGKLVTVEKNGSLCITDPYAGTWALSAKAGFCGTRFLFPISGAVYGIDASGNLFAIG